MSNGQPAAAFAALEAIEAGEWDRFLLRLRAAIERRRSTPEYEAHIVAGSGAGLVSEGQHPLFGNRMPDGSAGS